MSEVNDIKCDVCGARRGAQAAGWLTVMVDGEGIQFIPDVLEGATHLCGAACAVRRLSSWAHDLTMEVPA